MLEFQLDFKEAYLPFAKMSTVVLEEAGTLGRDARPGNQLWRQCKLFSCPSTYKQLLLLKTKGNQCLSAK